MSVRIERFQRNYEKIVKHVLKFAPEILFLYGCVLPNAIFANLGRKSNVYARYRYNWMEVTNYPPTNAAQPLDVDDRKQPMMRHLERVNAKIAFSRPNASQLAEAYAERAMMSYEFEADWWCMFNIIMAKMVRKCPSALSRQLDVLLVKAFTRCRGDYHPAFSQLFPRVFCSTNARVHVSVQHGYHLLADRSMSKGMLVSQELPFIRVLTADHSLRCDHCLAFKPFVLMPCDGCSLVLYCSDACKKFAFAEYHALECPLIGILRGQYTALEYLAARLTIRAILLFNGNLKKLQRFCKQKPPARAWAKYMYANERKPVPSTQYLLAYNLATASKRLCTHDLLCDTAKAIGLATSIGEQMRRVYGRQNTFQVHTILIEMLVHHLQIARVNGLYTMRQVDNPEQVSPTRIGSVPFAMVLLICGSLYNHACTPNVCHSLAYDGTIQFTADTDIREGEQLYINYGVLNTWPRYRFICSCCDMCAEILPEAANGGY